MFNYGIRYECTALFTRPRPSQSISSMLTAITGFPGPVDCLLEIVLTGFISPAGASGRRPSAHSFVPRPATAAFAADYSTTPTGPVNTSLQGWEQVMHCGPVRGKPLLSAASATR